MNKDINTPYSTTIEYLSELKTYVGQELGLTDWMTITQEDINIFTKITHDEQWIHTDVERSKKESPYEQTIAQGFMILSLASKFSYECYKINDVVMGVNYGLNKVRFINAVKSGAQVRGRVVLQECVDTPGGAKYIVLITFELKGELKPACVAEFITQVYTK